jgi:hypothetical protein
MPIPEAMTPFPRRVAPGRHFLLVFLVVLSAAAGCGRRSGPDADLQLPATPAAAAAQVEAVFADAAPEVKETATAASEAVRLGDYEKAVVALQALKQTPQPTLEQGLAVHGYLVALEGELVNASASGDDKAKRAYELLRRLKRN